MKPVIKIAVPMAGFGSRMRPHTWSKAKPLIALAGKTVLDYVLEQFETLPDTLEREYVFIVGANQLEQIKAHMQAHHPQKQVHFVVQEIMRGQSDALYLAREFLSGPVLMSFCDTLIETDLSGLAEESMDAIAWVRPVDDPRRFGVAQVDDDGLVTQLIEKPKVVDNKLAVVGFYYFRRGEDLVAATDEQFRRKVTVKKEFFLVDAINIMLEKGAKMRTQPVDIWLDAGIPEALLETNRYLLAHGHDNSAEAAVRSGVAIIPPVYIHPTAQITASVIGPHVSIGKDCVIERAAIADAILEERTHISNAILSSSLLGRDVQVEGRAEVLNLGDNTWMKR